MMMLTKIKAWLIGTALFIVSVITLGGYAARQKRKAKEAQEQAEEAQRIIDQSQAIQQKMHGAKTENYATRQQNNERKNHRNYFDSL